ncbi:hypothetical protein [Chryseobacterium sp.]|nr:hypothetical protein [Chryseobacterium sp.]
MDRKTWLQVQIIELQKLLELVKEHPLMSIGYKQRLEKFKEELKGLN